MKFLELNDHRRVSFSRIGKHEHTTYLVEESDEGELRLIPARVIPIRDLQALIRKAAGVPDR